jgi:hypothetical protein
MTVDEMTELFEAASENFSSTFFVPDGRFGTMRTDLHVFLLLDSLVPPEPHREGLPISDFICAAEHDQIWLDVDIEKLAAVITPELVVELDAAGVMVDDNGLSMFA